MKSALVSLGQKAISLNLLQLAAGSLMLLALFIGNITNNLLNLGVSSDYIQIASKFVTFLLGVIALWQSGTMPPAAPPAAPNV